MGSNTKIIKRRITSVKNTRKITKAMEMVAAAKMRRAVQAAINTRTYATLAWEMLVNLAKTECAALPLLAVRPVEHLLIVLVTANRGLCGSLNSNIIRKTAEQLKNPKNISQHRLRNGFRLEPKDALGVEIIGVGKKGAEFARKVKQPLVASFSDLPDTPGLNDILTLTRLIIDGYEKKEYDKIVIAYTEYRSPLLQIAKLRQVLPISEIDLEKMLQGLPETPSVHPAGMIEIENDYLFEPNSVEVLRLILPRLVETQIYQSILESAASEHSARMMAMRSANDAAGEMIDELTLSFNKARQAGITQEIAEIASGAAALE